MIMSSDAGAFHDYFAFGEDASTASSAFSGARSLRVASASRRKLALWPTTTQILIHRKLSRLYQAFSICWGSGLHRSALWSTHMRMAINEQKRSSVA